MASPALGESERYDFILDSGKRFWRVQVKSTYVTCSPRYGINAMRGRTGDKKPYTAEQIDILVAYIVAADAWYVLPIGAFAPPVHLMFYPDGTHPGGRYEKYREAWELMKEEPDDRDLASSRVLGHLLPR